MPWNGNRICKKIIKNYDIVADGTEQAHQRIARVLWNDPATGVMRHADAGYDVAIKTAKNKGVDLPMIGWKIDYFR